MLPKAPYEKKPRGAAVDRDAKFQVDARTTEGDSDRGRGRPMEEQRPPAQNIMSPKTILTRKEMHVAELRAAGNAYKEIAFLIGCSQKTVEHHVSRVHKKLGIHKAAELPAALRQLKALTEGGAAQ